MHLRTGRLYLRPVILDLRVLEQCLLHINEHGIWTQEWHSHVERFVIGQF